jgi:hypothetical protein
MAEKLVVDPSRLKTAATTLQGLDIPAPPSAIVAPGTDSVSAAINKTLPIMESPVVDGLPAVKAHLTRTGSNIVAAAGVYADSDQRLSDHVSQVQFLGATESPAGAASAGPLLGAGTGTLGDKDDDKPKPKPEPAPAPKPHFNPGQFAQMVAPLSQGMQGMTQGMQSLMQSAQGAGGGAKLASDTKKTEQSAGDGAQLVNETKADGEKERPEASAEGAGPGGQKSESVPVPPATRGRPETTPSATTL